MKDQDMMIEEEIGSILVVVITTNKEGKETTEIVENNKEEILVEVTIIEAGETTKIHIIAMIEAITVKREDSNLLLMRLGTEAMTEKTILTVDHLLSSLIVVTTLHTSNPSFNKKVLDVKVSQKTSHKREMAAKKEVKLKPNSL
jgi:hypothetical protein